MQTVLDVKVILEQLRIKKELELRPELDINVICAQLRIDNSKMTEVVCV